ncbi:signal peptidase I [Planctomyces sp. SH-PL62]|uniref:signal peptidase I n=1 Tax=Planctomyces sp. SH-PL62 TaxID=1636152 RepID=UPI00078C64AF|nr:signal peptidase I [Planctomyces sp. SH-PL62]AMV36933.1 Signal peptidase I [Planctomyces sp. SH-PL62]
MGRTAASPPPAPSSKSSGTATDPRSRGAATARSGDGLRETLEALVVAAVAALVVRGFEAQAFVIPTGSMAPTLMGRHKEVVCPQCGFLYSVNASEEVEGSGPLRPVYSGVCVNCRHQATRLDDAPSYKGDRILVSMFPYDLPSLPGASPPERYDVVVFRYPEEPEVSYIKRLVGLPGETIRIHHGDLYIRPPGASDFRLQRKPLEHLKGMQIPVYDDTCQPRIFRERSEWRRWGPEPPTAGWKVGEPGLSFYRCDAATEEWADLRYRHLVPEPEQWEALLNDRTPSRGPRPTLITDFYSYNTNLPAENSDLNGSRGDTRNAWLQPHWVGDLTLAADLDVQSDRGEIRMELVKGGVRHFAEIDVATGKTRFLRGEEILAEFDGPVVGPGKRRLEFGNVDDRLTLLVDGEPIGGEGVEFDLGDAVPEPTAADLSPAAVSARGAIVSASDLVLKRDIYYTQTPGYTDYGPVWEDREPRRPSELFDFLSNPARFPNLARVRSEEYELGDDRFMMMGDNSPRSKDSRGWDSFDRAWDTVDRQSWEVPRSLVTGKAFFVYWPHGVPFGPDFRLSRDFRVPFRPYFERMRWIR